MSKKEEKQEVKKDDNEQKVVNKEAEQLKRINELEKQLAEQTLIIIEKDKIITDLRSQVKSLNESVITRAKEIAIDAQNQLDKKLKEYQDKFESESKENKKYALASSISEFVSILNQLDNAINQDVSDPKVKNYLTGLKMFVNMMKNWLKSNHIELIDIKINDHYDPNFMEAIDTVKDNDSTDYKVVKIIENGYKLHDRIIRPAKVIVSNKKM